MCVKAHIQLNENPVRVQNLHLSQCGSVRSSSLTVCYTQISVFE